MKRLPVFLLVTALILALVAGSTAVPRFVSAQDATPAAPNLPAQQPTISATLPDSTTVAGVLEESCWPQSSPDQQLCTFASDSAPTQTITLASDQAVTFSVSPAEPPPSALEAVVYLDPPPANAEAALTIDLSAVQGKLDATALPAGSSNFLVAVIASYAVADGGEYYVRSNFKVSSDAGTAVVATAEATQEAGATSAATTEATIVVSAPTAETPAGETPTVEPPATTEAATTAVATPEATAEAATATEATSGLVTATPVTVVTQPTVEVGVTVVAPTVEGTAAPTQAMSVAEEATMLAQTRNAVSQPATAASGTTGAATATLPPPTATNTLTPSNTATPTFTATFTPTFTFTPTPTNTATFTNTPTPTSTFTPTPTPTNTPLAPDLLIRVGGRDFTPIRMTVSFTGSEGDAVTVSRAVREGSFRVLASPADAAQILFTGPRPSAITVTLLSSDGLNTINTQTLTPDNLVLYTLPSELGAYVVAIEVQFTQLSSVRATYYFRLVVGS